MLIAHVHSLQVTKTGSITQSWYQIIQGSFIAGKNVQLMEVNLKDEAAIEDFISPHLESGVPNDLVFIKI